MSRNQRKMNETAFLRAVGILFSAGERSVKKLEGIVLAQIDLNPKYAQVFLEEVAGNQNAKLPKIVRERTINLVSDMQKTSTARKRGRRK